MPVLPVSQKRPITNTRLTDNPYIYWGSVYAATVVTVGALTAATSQIVRLLWRTDPFHPTR